MTSRDQMLALLMIGIMTLAVGAAGGYFLVWQPIQAKNNAEIVLQEEIDKLKAEERAQAAAAKKFATARARSLPADVNLAKNEYRVALTRLLEAAGAPSGNVTITQKVMDNSARQVPEISKGKPIYNRIAYDVTIKKADMWVVKDFLKGYYELGLLHQITHFSIKKDEDTTKGVKRNDLTVILTTEAVIVDGAENRRTLLPVPNAFAAIGGGAMFQGMRSTPEAGRGVAPQILTPVLATPPRDYSLIVLKDPFNGVLPKPPDFKVSPIKDVKVVQDEKPSPVKVAVSGEGWQGAKVSAVISGGPFAEGALKVDPKTLAIELPKTSASEGSATVSVVATSADGKVEKTSFKVSVEEKKDAVVETRPEPTKPDVSGAIILTIVTFRSDGTASAAIRDAANRQRYEIEFEGKKVTISKFWYIKDKKVEDSAPNTQGVLVISDDNSSTKRTFKVVAVDGEGLILQDQTPAVAKPKAPGGFGPGFGKGGLPRQTPTTRLTAAAGGVATGVAALAPGKVYRWTVGQSLKLIEELTDTEAKKALKQAADTGPMFEVAATGK